MKRRQFIKAAGTAVSVPLLLNGMRVSAMPRSFLSSIVSPESDRVLVLIQLNGGNDGLNMVVPLDQYDNLANVRSNIILPENSILAIEDTVGLHPAMTGIRNLYDNGKMGLVQSVGYPNQNRSHFRSSDIWTSGSPAEEVWTTGWLGRYFESLYPSYPNDYPNSEYPDPFAITMGTIVSETCQGTATNFSLTLNDPFSLAPLTEGSPSDLPNTPYGEELAFLRLSISQANEYGDVITDAAQNGASMAAYPEGNRLATQLKNVALLMSGGLQTKVYVVSLGGFDTHANQVDLNDVTAGDHAELLQQLSDAVAAFQSDLQMLGLEQRVVCMTFSEFGRRIRSNDSRGTDHGTAAPLMLFGSCVNPAILGDNPEISTDVSIDEGVPMQHDFRDVYGSLLMDWFGVSEDNVRSLLYNDFQYLPLLVNCSVTSTRPDPKDEAVQLGAYPNPCRNWTTISFTSANEWVKLSLFDAIGNEIKVITNQRFQAGDHTIQVDMHGLPTGTYFYRLQLQGRQKTKRVVKG